MRSALHRVLLVSLAALMLGPLIWLAYTVFTVRLEAKPSEAGVTFDVQWLGEYEASLAGISIRSIPDERIVWQALPVGRSLSARTFSVTSGDNPTVLPGLQGNPSLRIEVPSNSDHFALRAGQSYRLEVVASSLPGGLCLPGFTCRTVTFSL